MSSVRSFIINVSFKKGETKGYLTFTILSTSCKFEVSKSVQNKICACGNPLF